MKAIEIFTKTRLYLGDMSKTRYSDWEVFSGINDALRLVAEENAKVGGPLFRKRTALSLDPESLTSELPADFVRALKAFGPEMEELLNVHNDAPLFGEFSVKGNSLVAADSPVTLWYFSYPPTLSATDDELDLPSSMAIPVAKIACECVKNSNDKAVEMSEFFYGGTTQNNQQ